MTCARSPSLVAASRRLCRAVDALHFSPPVACVYNPLRYARSAHERYIEVYARAPKRVVFLGMNPGPWGMAQTGVPFGDVRTVADWLHMDAAIRPPRQQHPARPVLGLACPRIEVSGARLWGLVRERFGEAAAFFVDHFVANYCPLMFLESSGKNRTPDKLPPSERDALFRVCDVHLTEVVLALRPAWLVGIGAFAVSRARLVVEGSDLKDVRVASVPHPSPASPLANSGWAALAERALRDQGVWA